MWVYVLRCRDNTFYVGHTSDVDARLRSHLTGAGATYTASRLPLDLVYQEACQTLKEALHRERQLKGWSAQKKAALIAGDSQRLKQLSKRRRVKAARAP